jgi:hypothetical protein
MSVHAYYIYIYIYITLGINFQETSTPQQTHFPPKFAVPTADELIWQKIRVILMTLLLDY